MHLWQQVPCVAVNGRVLEVVGKGRRVERQVVLGEPLLGMGRLRSDVVGIRHGIAHVEPRGGVFEAVGGGRADAQQQQLEDGMKPGGADLGEGHHRSVVGADVDVIPQGCVDESGADVK